MYLLVCFLATSTSKLRLNFLNEFVLPLTTVLPMMYWTEEIKIVVQPTTTFAFRYTFVLGDRVEWPFQPEEFAEIEAFYTHSSRRNRIACIYVKCCRNARYTLLFSHGNAVDLGQMCSFYFGLGSRIGCNVFSYDYSGYGCSNGKPSEKNLYADIQAAWQALRTRYGISADRIILYGQSIGTVPTVDLASKFDVAAVVLHSPLMSGMRVAFPDTRRTWCFDAFPRFL